MLPPPPLAVVEHGPRGRADEQPTLFVRFNQPVISLEQNGEEGAAPRFEITPPVEGHAYFQTPEYLVFEPKYPLALAHRYSVRLRPPITAQSGARWEGMEPGASGSRELVWELESARPKVESSSLDQEERRSRTAPFLIEFSQDVAPESVARSLSVAASISANKFGPAIPVRVTPSTEAEMKEMNRWWDRTEARRFVTVRPAGLWPADSVVVAKVRPGMIGKAGPLPLDTPWEGSFKTIGPLRALGHSCTVKEPCAQDPLRIRFNNPIPYEETEDKFKRVTVTPKPEFLWLTTHTAYDDEEGMGGTLEIEGAFLPGVTYHVTVSAELRDEYKQRLGQALSFDAIYVRRPQVALSSERGMLRPGLPQTIGITSRHVAALSISAQLLDDAKVAELMLPQPASKGPARPAGSQDDPDSEEADPKLPAPQPQFTRSLRLKPQGPTDWSSVVLDLNELGAGGRGALLVEIRATELLPKVAGNKPPAPVRGLFRLTDLGPVLTVSQPRSLVGVYRLSDAQPVAGAKVVRLDDKGQPTGTPEKPAGSLGVTDASGLAALPGPLADDRAPQEVHGLYAVSLQGPDGKIDRAYLPLTSRSGVQTVKPQGLRRGEHLRLRIVTERDAYRPGETVRVVGWAAIDTPFAASGLRRVPAELAVELTVKDPRRRLVASRRVSTTAEGKFWAELPLPAPGTLGGHSVSATLLGSEEHVYVKVEDYRVPEFAVTATVEKADLIAPESAQVRASATYFFGGPVLLKAARGSQDCGSTHYRPPGLEHQFEVGAPLLDGGSRTGSIELAVPGQEAQDAQAAQGGSGRGRIAFAAPPSAPNRDPRRCTVSVSLYDGSHQSIGAETSYLVHPARYYLAVRTPRYLTEGDPLSIAVRAVAFDGTRVAAEGARVAIERVYDEKLWKTVGSERVFDRTVEHRDPVPGCTLRLGASGPDVECLVPRVLTGRYVLRLSGGPDAAAARTEAQVYVRERDPAVRRPPPPPPRERLRYLSLTTSVDQAKPGDTVDVRISSPWPLEGALMTARNGLRQHHPFSIRGADGGDAVMQLSVDDTWVPMVTLELMGVRPQEPVSGKRSRVEHPTVHTTSRRITVEPTHRKLQVQVSAPSESTPGATVPIRVSIRDSAERPTAARVALWAVDEAVLSLTNYEVPDLLHSFIPEDDVQTFLYHDFRSLLLPYLVESDPWLTPRGAFGSGAGHLSGRRAGAPAVMMGSASVQQARQRFETTPLFLGDVAVGPDGQAEVKALLPDNLTTFRITAVASARLVDGESPGRFGLGDARLRVSQPFLVRAALPRLMRPGDEAQIGALLNNLAGPAGAAEVQVILHQAQPVLALVGAANANRGVEAGDQLRVPFTLRAERAGTAEVEVRATLRAPAPGNPAGRVLTDSIRLPLSVEVEPALIERVAAYGTLTDSEPVAIPLKVPGEVRPQLGGLEVTVSASLLGDLKGAVQALIEYPYGCLEQTTSRLIPLAALPELAKLFPGLYPDAAQQVQVGVLRLTSMQVAGGGFAYWPGGTQAHVYATAYATWALHQLKQAGYAVPSELITGAADFLDKTLAPPDAAETTGRRSYDEPLARIRRAMAVHALAELGRKPVAAIDDLFLHRAELPVFSQAMLVLALHAAAPADSRIATLTDELVGRIAELPGSARVRESVRYRLDVLFHSDARSDALVLWALLHVRPDHAAIPKLVRGLLGQRSATAWRNTQENAYSLLALAAYGKRFEATAPRLHLDAWLGRSWFGAADLSDRAARPQLLSLPMPRMLSAAEHGDAGPLLLRREGEGRLYYRVGLSWAPAATELPARSQGLRIERSLRTQAGALALDGKAAVAIGEPVAIDLEIENRGFLSYVAIDVPLPAGLEGVQRSLGRGQASVMLSGSRGVFVSHEELRPDRVVVFADDLPPGKHRHTLYVRPTTPGRFSLPPARAEAMYEPEVYGRSVGTRLTVK